MNAKEAAIKSMPLFAQCSKSELELVARFADAIDLPEGRVLMREGEPGRELYILVAGTAEVTRGGEVLATLGPGGHFGEMALVSKAPRMATVTATSPVDVLVMSAQGFASLRAQLPNLDQSVIAEIEARARENAEHA